MTMRMKIWEEREEARAEGIAQGMAQGIEKGMAQGMEKGILAMLSLVTDGLIDSAAAAKRLNMSSEEFSAAVKALQQQ